MMVEHKGLVAYASDSYNAFWWYCPIYNLKTNDCIYVAHLRHKPNEYELKKIMERLIKNRK